MAVIYILDTSELIVNDELIDRVEKKRQEKIRRIDNNLIKKEKLGAGLLLKELFDEYGIENQELIYNENGKPYLNTNEWYFSISHSSGVVIVSLSKNEIGIDIEEMKIYNPSLAKKIMNNDEYSLYEKLSELEKHKYFYQVWTAKEAIVKKRGTSITVNPANIIIDEDVITRRYIINKKAYMIASCGMGEFRVIEKRIEKE